MKKNMNQKDPFLDDSLPLIGVRSQLFFTFRHFCQLVYPLVKLQRKMIKSHSKNMSYHKFKLRRNWKASLFPQSAKIISNYCFLCPESNCLCFSFSISLKSRCSDEFRLQVTCLLIYYVFIDLTLQLTMTNSKTHSFKVAVRNFSMVAQFSFSAA